ncbi:MAG: HD domain-containing protein [Candidatus Njordarchaeia archaeon]
MEEEIINVIRTVGMLKRMPRMGWLYAGIPRSIVESVAEHSFRTAFIAMLLCNHFSGKSGKQLDCLKVLKMAILHDVPESVFMDVGGEARDILGKELRTKAEKEGIKRLLENLPSEYRDDIYSIWSEYEEQNSTEAKIVRASDKLEMFVQAYEYCLLGVNKILLKEFSNELDNYISNLKRDPDLRYIIEIFETLGKMFDELE